MRISVRHVTRYRYEEPVTYTIQRLRLSPPNGAGQKVLDWQIEAPGIDQALRFTDAFGNLVHVVSQPWPHEETVITARGTVVTTDTAGILRDLPDYAPPAVFLRFTERTSADDRIRDLAETARDADPVARMHTLMGLVRDAIDYEIGSTDEDSTATDALAAGRGVCQDHAHVFLAAVRHLGFPGRYVSGYFVHGADEVAEAHHAWAEVFLNGLGWVGFDVANRICPTEAYVRLSCGLDAASAAPVRGCRRGGGRESLEVAVAVELRQSQQ